MEPQHPPPLPATFANQRQQLHQLSPSATPDEYEYTHNEKDEYAPQLKTRAERGSKTSSNGRGRDSVISHPFSPKQSYPPSPTSTISSAGGRRHRSIPEIQLSTPTQQGQSITCPPQAHLDPEKHGYGLPQSDFSHRHSGSGRGANDAVYDQGEYHENEPEEKAWQLLVSNSSTREYPYLF
jgi:hypothetical protein